MLIAAAVLIIALFAMREQGRGSVQGRQMMRKIVMVAAGLAATFTGGAVLADPPTGSRLGDHRQKAGPSLSARDQAVGARRMADCLYNRKPDMARATLGAASKAHADAAAATLNGNVTCFGATFSNELVEERRVDIPPDIMRGMLAEAALQRARPAVDALQPLPLQPGYARPWFAITGRHVNVDEMGACLADTNPAAAATLIRSEHSSKDESAAFAGLVDNLGKCLRAGTRLQASRPALRAALAEALYQRINAPAEVNR